MSVHLYLKAARMESGLTLREAASKIGVSFTTLYRYEEGLIKSIPYHNVKKLLSLYENTLISDSDKEFRLQQKLRYQIYSESRQEITAGFLFELYNSLDERGKSTVFSVLMHEYHRSGLIEQSFPPLSDRL